MGDNAIPKGGFLKITLPTGVTGFTPTACNAWPLAGATTLKYPGDTATGIVKGTVAGSTGVYYCSYASALTAATAYGVHLPGASGITAG